MHREFCGLNADRPKFRSYHIIDEEQGKRREECYLQHVILCYDEWRDCVKTFIGSVVRRFAALCDLEVNRCLINDLEEGLKVAVIHHDVGKLANEYQNREWYRHEVVGAHAVYNILFDYLTDKPYKDLLCALISAAVYLHHEAIQMARKWLKLRSPTFEYLNSKVGSLSFTFEERARQAFEAVNELNGLSIKWKLPENMKGGEVVKTVSGIISLLDGMPRVNTTRLCLASMTLLISEVDNRAAERGRT
ncbi:MAG: CRISPR-associated endonuclease Cas3'' [Thermofilaceae archaeon]|nr:CRISPR-associated endonuclease Cas3'' [Thermofilaceae archaeon]